MVRRINALVFIHIKVNSQSDAFRLFEVINNRGVPLSALDIIKNAMLAALKRETTGSIDEAFEMWSLEYKVGAKKLSLANTAIWNEKHILARGKVLTAAIMKAFTL